MRARNYVSPDEWASRLNAEMERVLADPANFPPATVLWARWRRTWLEEHETPFRFHGEGGKNLYGVSRGTAARDEFSRRPPRLNAAGRRGGEP